MNSDRYNERYDQGSKGHHSNRRHEVHSADKKKPHPQVHKGEYALENSFWERCQL